MEDLHLISNIDHIISRSIRLGPSLPLCVAGLDLLNNYFKMISYSNSCLYYVYQDASCNMRLSFEQLGGFVNTHMEGNLLSGDIFIHQQAQESV